MSATSGESRYQRLRLLGRGGTAEVEAVYLPDRKVTAALKRPLPDSPDSREQFCRLAAREAILIERERFPGLVRILAPPDSPANSLLLELCTGPTLNQIGRIDSIPLLLNIMSALALDLAFLKARGIIHGDIKPHNFFVPPDWQSFGNNELFFAKLSDFSLGRFELEPESARAGVGTVGYMAPETIVDGRTSHQSDLFALGVIAYQLATGLHPFMDEDVEPMRVNARVAEELPKPVDEIRNDLSHGFAELIASLMAKRESERPRTAYDVCCALETLGAQYPFRKALRPTHLLSAARSYADALSATVSSELLNSPRLSLLSKNEQTLLRLVLSQNWRNGRVRFDGARFSPSGDLLWPSRLRRKALESFSRLPLTQKRRTIVQAVLASSEQDLIDINPDANSDSPTVSAISEMLIHLLRPRTVRRIARRHASPLEQSGRLSNASRLYILAGDMINAERCACDATSLLVSDHQADQALRVLRRVISYAELRGELFSARESLMRRGDTLKEIGESDKALQVYRQIIEIYKEHTPDKLLAETYKDLGDLYKMRQDFRSGIESLERALTIYRELGDVVEISRTLNNLGNIHWVNSDLGTALKYYRTALRIQRSEFLQPEIASTLNNIASIYALRSKFSRSIRMLNLSLALKRELGHAGEIARTLNNLGYVYAVSGRTSLAVDSLKESLIINRRIGSRKEQLFNLENLSETTLQLGRVRESIQHLEEGLALAKDLQDKPHLATLYLNLTNAHLRLGHTANAVRSLSSARSFLDQIDHQYAEAFWLVLTSRTRLYIGDYSGALAHALAAGEMALKLEDRQARLQALIIATRLSDDPALFSEAEAIAKDLLLNRERLILVLGKVERALEQQKVSLAQDLLEQVTCTLEAPEEDIELPRMHAIIAEICIETGRTGDASTALTKAYSSAARMGLVPEITTILALRARIESMNQAYEQCYATSRQALQMIRQLAENIDNDDDRAIYLNRRTVQNLMVEVRRLGAVLGQKQRAE